MFRDYFYFRKSDRKTILILAVVAVICVGVVILKNSSSRKSANTGQLAAQQQLIRSVTEKDSANNSTQREEKKVFQDFDPNTVSYETLLAMGISEKKAQVFINYRNAGKVFREPDDLLDTYGWTEEDIAPLLPYLHIDAAYGQQDDNPRGQQFSSSSSPSDSFSRERRLSNVPTDSSNTRERYTSNKFKTLTLVDPNTADTTLLQRIPGIGPYYARSIVRLRERFGGITNLEQLFEINNFPEEALEWLELSAQPKVRQISLNQATFKQLAAHPYIGYEHTKAIQNYIRLYGPITSLEQLRNIHIFTDEELNRLLPYLKF